LYTTFILRLNQKSQEQVTSKCERIVVRKFVRTGIEKPMHSLRLIDTTDKQENDRIVKLFFREKKSMHSLRPTDTTNKQENDRIVKLFFHRKKTNQPLHSFLN